MHYGESVNNIMDGFEQGLVSQEEIERLNKAISAGYGGAGKPTDLVYGGVLQAESLESTLKSITFDMGNLKFWPAVSVDKAYNLFEQYNRLVGFGSDSQPYIGEGGAPQEEDSTYVRDGQKIVFFGTRRKVTHQMTLVRTTVGDIVAQQAKEGTMHLLKNVERELYWGHAHFMNSAGLMTGSNDDIPRNSIAMNGLLKQLTVGDTDRQQISRDFEGYGDSDSIGKDLDGGILTQDDVEALSVIALENFGNPTELHIEPRALSAFIQQFYPQFRSAPGLSNQTVGYDVSKVVTSAGSVDLKPNLFLRPRAGVRSQGVNANAPSAVSGASGGESGANDGSLVDGATYKYRITEVNDYGEGAPSAEISQAVGSGESSIDITLPALSAGGKYFKIYRTAAGGAAGTERFIGNAVASFRDVGTKQPGLGEAFLLDMRAETMRFRQLSPLSKINFAIVSTALEFAIVMYGALFVYCPRFVAFFKNVGK